MSPESCAVEVYNVSKCHKIYERPTDRLREFVLPPLRRSLGLSTNAYHRPFWSLRDVSFTVPRGETVALVGQNGAGKSTLLQVVAGILVPTSGSVRVAGRVAALLELGAGFNPNFTGLENVRLNAALLGLESEEIEARLPAILEFAAIGPFVSEPVRTYSSGMYMRLAFAVSVLVEPDVLIVDEALAVGDIAFQYKCYRRLDELKRRGVTIIMVTHSTAAVLEHADRAILLEHGRLVRDDRDVLSVVADYERVMRGLPLVVRVPRVSAVSEKEAEVTDWETLIRKARESRTVEIHEQRFGTCRAIIDRVHVSQGITDQDDDVVIASRRCILRFSILSSKSIERIALGVSLRRADSPDLWGDNNVYAGVDISLHPGCNEVEYEFQMPLSAGEYLLFCGLADVSGPVREELDQRWPAKRIVVVATRQQAGVSFAPIVVRRLC